MTTSPSPTVLVFDGHGYGHGVGLAQWGAYGYALHGWTYDRILAHYYTGTTLGPAPVVEGEGAHRRGQPGDARRDRSMVGRGRARASKTALSVDRPADATAVARRSPGPPLTGPLTITSSRPLLVNGQAFRGRLTVLSDGKALQVVDTVGLEAYVKGVVAAEMPKTWPAAALEAQAVAARSYAHRQPAEGRLLRPLRRRPEPDLRRSGRSRRPATNAAVDATRGQVVLWHGAVADTLYSVELRRSHRLGASVAGAGHSLPRLGRRPVRQPVALPRLGAGRRRAAPTQRRALKLRSRVEDVQDDR